MMTVRIDNQQTFQDIGQIKTMPDLIELVKARIDPERIITGLSISGQELSDTDWRVPLSVQGDATLEVTTGTKEEYVSTRLQFSVECIAHVTKEFDEVSAAFRGGNTAVANTAFQGAVEDLRSFLTWYDSILGLLPANVQGKREVFYKEVEKVSEICKKLIEQQLYNSWWAISETITNQLQPQLKRLESICMETKQSANC